MPPKFPIVAAIAATCFAAMLSASSAAPPKPTPEERYIATRDAAMKANGLPAMGDLSNALQ